MLTESAIKLYALIWYQGRMSMGTWNCPALIVKVDKKRRTFRVKSLDDFEDQDQDYDFDATPGSPDSRKSMRPASNAEVNEYLTRVIAQFELNVRDASPRDFGGFRSKLAQARKLKERLSKK